MIKIKMRTWKLSNVILLLLGIGWVLFSFVAMFRIMNYMGDNEPDAIVFFFTFGTIVMDIILVLFFMTDDLYDEYEVEMQGKKLKDC